jgi:hypothetical protein
VVPKNPKIPDPKIPPPRPEFPPFAIINYNIYYVYKILHI